MRISHSGKCRSKTTLLWRSSIRHWTIWQAKLNATDREALKAVRLVLSKNAIHTIINAKTTKELIKTLTKRYKAPTANNKVYLTPKVFNKKMHVFVNISKHVNNVHRLLNYLTSLGIDFDDEIYTLCLPGQRLTVSRQYALHLKTLEWRVSWSLIMWEISCMMKMSLGNRLVKTIIVVPLLMSIRDGIGG